MEVAMRMRIAEVVEVAKKFAKDQAGNLTAIILSVEAVENQSKWRVVVDTGIFNVQKKELIIDDSDGNVLAYRETK